MKITNDTKRHKNLRTCLKVGVSAVLLCIIFPSLIGLIIALVCLIAGVSAINWMLKKFISSEAMAQWNKECVARSHRIRKATREDGYLAKIRDYELHGGEKPMSPGESLMLGAIVASAALDTN